MNFKDFPVIETADFTGVMIDAMRNPDNTYSAIFSFFTKFGDETIAQSAEGYAWLTNLAGDSLLELYAKIDIMVDVGLFTGVRVSAEGTLYDEHGIEISPIDWNSFVDDDEDITDDIVASRTHTLH